MNFAEYQKAAESTAIYNERYKVVYPAIVLPSEVGEGLNRVHKVLRDKDGVFNNEDKEYISKELGGALWGLSMLCSDLGIELNSVAEYNISSLQSRKERGTLGGSGNER